MNPKTLSLLLMPIFLLLLCVSIWMIVEFNKITFAATSPNVKGTVQGVLIGQLGLYVLATVVCGYFAFSHFLETTPPTKTKPTALLLSTLIATTFLQIVMSYYFGELVPADTTNSSYTNFRLYLYFGTIAYILAIGATLVVIYMINKEPCDVKKIRADAMKECKQCECDVEGIQKEAVSKLQKEKAKETLLKLFNH